MTIVATLMDEPPRPPRKFRRRRPRTDPVKATADIPFYRFKSFPFVLWEGFTVILSVTWATHAVWASLPESRPDSGWVSWDIGFVMLGFRLDW